ncbi:MAG TPA: hypothetical protein VL096_00475, partial [Pirellulaceae bacterium]|nr:hypothetical protein [Pirellulaceae bacterium]
MKSKNRRAPAPPPESPAALLAAPRFDWSTSATALLVVVVLIACYAAVYFQQYDFRWSALILLFAPEQLVSAWSGKVDELPMGVFDRLPIILVAACIVAIAWAMGSLVLRGWKLDERLTRFETELFSTGLGLSIWTTWTLLIGLCGGLHQTWLLWLPGILATSVAGFQLAGRTAALRDRPPLLPRRANDWLWPSALWLGLPFAIIYVLAGAVPPGEFDVLE